VNNLELVLLMENTLGLRFPPNSGPEWKGRRRQAGILIKKRETDPQLYSEQNICLAIKWAAKHRKPIKSAVAVLSFIPAALKEQGQDGAATDPLSRRVQRAIAHEQALGDPDGWVATLTRCRGPVRGEVLAEWRQAKMAVGYSDPEPSDEVSTPVEEGRVHD